MTSAVCTLCRGARIVMEHPEADDESAAKPCQRCATAHDPVITEDDAGFWHAACTCGWCELAGHAYREVAADHHDDHVAEVSGDGDDD